MGRGKSAQSLALVDAAREILAKIHPTTIRSVCYQLFILGVIKSMAKSETNRVSTQLTWARENHEIPCEWLVDETREPERVSAWADPAAYVETVKRAYRRDRWTDQPEWIEFWSEKGSIRGTLAPVLQQYGVTFRVTHGYASATAVYQAATESRSSDKTLTAFYVGDWDPSGLHMSEVDLPKRLREYGGDVDLVRLALTEEDIQSGLPSFPVQTKRDDARHNWYVGRSVAHLSSVSARQHAADNLQCWELDALNPVTLRQRVERVIVAGLDVDAWERAERTEAAERESLTTILNAWPGISWQASKYLDEGEP